MSQQDDRMSNLVVFSNKFFPPHIDESQSLLRQQLLEAKFPDHRHNKKAIIIEAQAGQGKTTLAYQFLRFYNNRFIWYQIGQEDSDPVFLISSLLTNLTQNLDTFCSPQLETILREGSVGPLDLIRCANILLKDLDGYLGEDIYLVFDDLHLLEFGALTLALLEHLIDNSPHFVHFLLISRHPIEIKSKTIRDASRIAYLNTTDLALNNHDIEALYSLIFKKDISSTEALQIQRLTNGWIMGIILASHPISGKEKFWTDQMPPVEKLSRSGHLLDYFQEEIFAQIPKQLHAAFLKCSFLQEIPADLAAELTGIDGCGELLSNLSKENYFIYCLASNRLVFRFHHFFQEFLQQRGRAFFSKEEVREIYHAEAEYYLRLDMTEKALTCYRNAEEYGTMEKILRRKGMNLIIKNRTLTILNLLQTIPDEILHAHGWLTLYAGLLRIDYIPQTTLPFFDIAIRKFIADGDETGEIIALSLTIYYHFVISGQYHTGSVCLPRTEELFLKNQNTLDMPVVVWVTRALAAGFCFFNGEMDKARHYVQIASKLASRENIQNFIAHARFIQGYIELLSGNRAKYLRDAEACFLLLHNPLVGESNRLTIRVMNLCYLSMTGDQINYTAEQLSLQKAIAETIVNQTVAAPYLYVWNAANFFAQGLFDNGLNILEKGGGISNTAATPHMQSQLLQWQAFGLALKHYHREAIDKISEAAALRSEAGGPFYIAFHAIIAGAVYTRTGDFDRARTELERGLALAQTMPSTYLVICALFNISYLKYLSESPDNALDDLEPALSMLKINGYEYFWSWEPAMMTALLSIAVERDIEKSFAQKLARKHLHVNFSELGKALPLLQFTLLDRFEISMNSNILFRTGDLTPFQRELLGLLITARGQRIPQEKIQLELWPESPPENARKSFDTLLTRMRKLLTPHLNIPIKKYLNLQKGILGLSNYDIDALHFIEAARTGLAHFKNSEYLQANNAFQIALSYWKGVLPEEAFQSEQVYNFNDVLSDLLVEVAKSWCQILMESGRNEEAILLLERVLQINYLEEELTLLLYRCHIINGNPLKAREINDRYRKALLRSGYSLAETEDFLEQLVRSTST
jgi:DNA-binding SARP family transcriptional activator